MVGPVETSVIGAIVGSVISPLSSIAFIYWDRRRRGIASVEQARNPGVLKADTSEYIPLFGLSLLLGPFIGGLLGFAVQTLVSH